MAELDNTIINDTGYIQLPSGTTAQRPANPSQGMIRWNSDYEVIEYYDGSSWNAENYQNLKGTSAQQILTDYPNAPSGIYYITWGSSEYPIYCEMNLQGGGWMMILNYVHLGETNPALNVRTNSFPILNSNYSLGEDESNTVYWGHISNSLCDDYNWTQYMFYGKTSLHSRIIHFYGNNTNIVNYMKTGSGSMVPYYVDTSTNFNGELYNSASIPFYINEDRSGFSNQGDLAMTNFPMYGNSTIGNPRAHWGIRGLDDRWEVDDQPSVQNGSDFGSNTIHRIWVK